VIVSSKRSVIVGSVCIVLIGGARELLGRRIQVGRLVVVASTICLVAVSSYQLLLRSDTTVWRFTRLFEQGQADASVAARFDLLEIGWLVYREAPITGVGLTGFGSSVAEVALGSEYEGYGMHNTYAAVLVEMGAIGALLFVFMVGRTVLIGLRSGFFHANMGAYTLLALPPLLYGLTEYNLTPGQIAFWPLWIVLLLPRMPTESSRGPERRAAEAEHYPGPSIGH
jgi:O-antigen ligase